MSLLAGFDILTEISNETITKMLKKNLQIGGNAVIPPFELSVPLSGGGVSGTAHLIVNDLVVDLNANDTITITLFFDRTSAMIGAPLNRDVCPLDGNLTITAAVQLVNTDGNIQRISFNLGAATTTINWSAAANHAISSDLAGTAITPALFTQFATQAISNFVRSIPAPVVPIGFTVVPGVNGCLNPSLQFEKLEVHCIPNANRSQQALGLFGILLVANHNNGNHNQKTSRAITAANDGICVSISPQAFHSLVFCPSIAKALRTTVNNLPTSCGGTSGFNKSGVTINNINDSFANGHIDINGSVSKSGKCYDADGTFHGRITLSISGSTLTPNVHMDEPDVSVDIPWYCYLAVAVILGPIGLVLTGIADMIADVVATSLAGAALKGALGSEVPGVGVGGLSGASFSSVSITGEGLTMQGSVSMPNPLSSASTSLDIGGSVTTRNSQQIGSGEYITQLWCMSKAKTYPYTESLQQQAGSYQLTGTMVSQPLVPHFRLGYGEQSIPLTGMSGTATITGVQTHYPMPLATGGQAVTQDVHIDYTINGTSVQLTNNPEEGNYGFALYATATDCAGNPIKWPDGSDMNSYEHVAFEGHHVSLGNGYYDDVQQCREELERQVRRISDKYKISTDVPKWVMVNYPPPDEMIRYIREIAALPEAEDILREVKIAHGNSFYRAILSPAATQPALLKVEQQVANRQGQVRELVGQIRDLTQQLLTINSLVANVDAQQRGFLKDIDEVA